MRKCLKTKFTTTFNCVEEMVGEQDNPSSNPNQKERDRSNLYPTQNSKVMGGKELG